MDVVAERSSAKGKQSLRFAATRKKINVVAERSSAKGKQSLRFAATGKNCRGSIYRTRDSLSSMEWPDESGLIAGSMN
jgi:hypothetical protein